MSTCGGMHNEIMRSAQEAYDVQLSCGASLNALICKDGKDYVLECLEKAILAERQRCAQVADAFRQAHDTGSGFDSQPARATAFAIRETILTKEYSEFTRLMNGGREGE